MHTFKYFYNYFENLALHILFYLCMICSYFLSVQASHVKLACLCRNKSHEGLTL